ncbi:MAG: GNAT family N-acetyltransferase [Proteobacteria bacterium]|nr:GNAT family N-acetyltransferase [Pseudomonadota bacterium]
MEIDDLAPVFHLGEKLFDSDILPSLYRTWDEYEVIDFFSTNPEFCLVAEHNGELAGFVLGNIIEKNNSPWKYGYLVWMGVAPQAKPLGLGIKLFKYFKSLMKKNGVHMLIVDTDAENTEAIKFFQKMGFTNPKSHVYMSSNLSRTRKRTSLKTADNTTKPINQEKKPRGSKQEVNGRPRKKRNLFPERKKS